MTLMDILGTIFNATMIGIGTGVGNYIATRHLIGTLKGIKQKRKKVRKSNKKQKITSNT